MQGFKNRSGDGGNVSLYVAGLKGPLILHSCGYTGITILHILLAAKIEVASEDTYRQRMAHQNMECWRVQRCGTYTAAGKRKKYGMWTCNFLFL